MNNITFAAEFRNRLFTGDMVRSRQSYSEIIGTDHGLVDLSWNILDEQSFFLNTTIDRLWVDFNYGKFQARIGRQRINWGQTLVWNPNDIFNVYSYFDFDYVESPGSDAVRLQYYPDSSSAVEIAVKAIIKIRSPELLFTDLINGDMIFSFLQVISTVKILLPEQDGQVHSDLFHSGVRLHGFSLQKTFADSTGTGIFTIGFDKTFRNNSMVQVQVMYCNNPVRSFGFRIFYIGTMSTKDLAFSKFSAFGHYSYPVTPLLNISLSAMWFPDLKGYYAGPSFDYSVAENVGLSLFWQHFESQKSEPRTRINIGFLRVKFSF